ncbi:RluA family pseudouridine synthase [Brevibacillus dissolubilis]|uniref:RluA family pseudouridine synthase n=1 Tax=Brevibacillus dissolubilis TaxID=1844116 RepID=UPI0011161DEB|nr:RluA family pseudouridine synthase [Brevibacillus dissolubilis]
MAEKKWLEFVVTDAEAGMTVEQIARDKLAVSGRMLQRLTRSKGIQLNRKAPFLKRQVKAGDTVSVRIADQRERFPEETPPPLPGQKLDVALDVLYEDDFFIVVNKPSGMMVHPVNERQTETLVHVLQHHWLLHGQIIKPHAVHRLDKETTGAVLIAKSSYAHQLADKVLREGGLERSYLAVVTGSLEQDAGTIDEPIARDAVHPTKRQVHPAGEPSVTHYRVLARSQACSLVELRLETGRTHQIRVHMESLGHPVAGDTLYGGKKLGFKRQALHAQRLSFVHPVTSVELSFTAGLPEDMKSFITDVFQVSV